MGKASIAKLKMLLTQSLFPNKQNALLFKRKTETCQRAMSVFKIEIALASARMGCVLSQACLSVGKLQSAVLGKLVETENASY